MEDTSTATSKTELWRDLVITVSQVFNRKTQDQTQVKREGSRDKEKAINDARRVIADA